MNRLFSGFALLALAALCVSPVSAQTTYTACRIPNVGAIYMIGVTGAPTGCLDPSHVEFSWTEGGAPADGSITTAKLADDAVTAAKIATDAVDGAAIAPDAVGSTEILNLSIATADIANDAITAAKIAAGAVGDSELGLQIVNTPSGSQTGQFAIITSTCPAGKVVIGGGHWLNSNSGPNPTSSFTTTANYPSSSTTWLVTGYWPSAQTSGFAFNVYAICVNDT